MDRDYIDVEVTERQVTEQWYEASGEVRAQSLYPTLLQESEAVYEIDLETEPWRRDGNYDGYPGDFEDVEELFDGGFEQEVLQEFHEEALEGAKQFLLNLKAESMLLHSDFTEYEEQILQEASQSLGVSIPWNPNEDAMVAERERIEKEKRTEAARQRELRIAEIKARLEAGESEESLRKAFNEPSSPFWGDVSIAESQLHREKAEKALREGKSHEEVRTMYPMLTRELPALVGRLRKEGVVIAANIRQAPKYVSTA